MMRYSSLAHLGWGLLRMLAALVSFLHSMVVSHLAQALATSMLSASKNRCGMGSSEEPLVGPREERQEATKRRGEATYIVQVGTAEQDHTTGAKKEERTAGTR